MHCEDCGDGKGESAAVFVLHYRAECNTADQQRQEQTQHYGCPDETKLLSHNTEDEIRPLLRNEVELRLRAVQISFAKQAAGSDGNFGLQYVVTCTERVGIRVEECGNALLFDAASFLHR